jgi:hypothetical protein
MEGHHEHHRLSFERGTTANLDLYRTGAQMTAVVTHHRTNPLNYGTELQKDRIVIVREACERLGCKPSQLRYIEQDGQHFWELAFSSNEWNPLYRDTAIAGKLVTKAMLADVIRSHGVLNSGPSAPDWVPRLTISVRPIDR